MDYQARVTTLQDRLDDMTEVELAALQALHDLLAEVKKNPRGRKYDPVAFIQDVEFTMQGLWGFSRDEDYHTHWLTLKGCTCPELDNIERFGTGKIINKSCPWHGTKEEV